MNFSEKSASDSGEIFFAHSVLLKLLLNSHIKIAMRKVACCTLTAGMLSKKFKETAKQTIARDKAYNFMNIIKDTPAYWKSLCMIYWEWYSN